MPRKKPRESDWPDTSGEPEGWRLLQERARNEQDPRKLEAIIAEMNQLLTEREQKAAGRNGLSTSRRGSPKKTSNDE